MAAPAHAASGGRQARAPHRPAAGILAGLAIVCLAVGLFVFVGRRLGEKEASPVAPASVPDGKSRAVALCESHIRKQVRAPFRVIAFRSPLAGEERGGYMVSGTVELQSAAGDLQRKKFWCRISRDAAAGMLVDEGKLY